jgi:hypothetical protein
MPRSQEVVGEMATKEPRYPADENFHVWLVL